MSIIIPKNTILIVIASLMLAGCGEKADNSATTTPGSLPDTLKVKRLSKTYVITGIGVSGSNRVAIINNEVVTPGAKMDSGVLVKEIHPTYATLIVGGTEHRLRPDDIQRKLDKAGQ